MSGAVRLTEKAREKIPFPGLSCLNVTCRRCSSLPRPSPAGIQNRGTRNSRAGKKQETLFQLLYLIRLKESTTLANTMETMLSSLIRMLIDGPEVSLKGSPTVSPTTAAL